MTAQQPEALRAFAHEILSLQAPKPLVQAQEPVAFALRWPSDTRLNLSTVFDTEKEAAEYAAYCSGGVLVVPLYIHPATQQPAPAAQGDAWSEIVTLPDSDDLVWLYCQDTNTIDGPVAPRPSMVDSWTHWAPAEAPSTAAIDAARAQAQQGGE